MRAAKPSLIFLSSKPAMLTVDVRVLIVEDELKMASLVHRGLAEEGHTADIASSGEDALWMAEAHPYDAIVLDVMLPGQSGFGEEGSGLGLAIVETIAVAHGGHVKLTNSPGGGADVSMSLPL